MDKSISFRVHVLFIPGRCDSESHLFLFCLLYYGLWKRFVPFPICNNVRNTQRVKRKQTNVILNSKFSLKPNPSHFRHPFDGKTPFGYLIDFGIQAVTFGCMMQSVHNNMCLLVGLCLMMIAFIDDFEGQFRHLNGKDDAKKSQSVKNKEFLQRFNNAIQFHADVRRLSNLESIFQHFFPRLSHISVYEKCIVLHFNEIQKFVSGSRIVFAKFLNSSSSATISGAF